MLPFLQFILIVVNTIVDLSGCQEKYSSSPSSFSITLDCGNDTDLANKLENLMRFSFAIFLTIPSGVAGLIFLITAQIISLSIRRYKAK